jgi:hypothetical protein
LFIDEADNLVGGRVVANGGEIYKDYFSQHTPNMYYISAFFHKLGLNGLHEQRISFYLLFACLLGLITYKFAPFFGLKTMWLGLVIYSSSFIFNNPVSYSIVSEHIQTISYIALFLVLVQYFLSRELKRIDFLWISFFSFLAIGTTFVSVYFVSIILIGYCYNIFRTNTLLFFRKSLKQVLELGSTFLIPWILFISWYLYLGNLNYFYQQSFKLNTEVYSLFTGLGNDVLAPYKTGIPQIIFTLKTTIYSLISNPSNAIHFLLITGSAIILVFYFFQIKNERFLGVATFFLFSVSAMRGTSGYHSTPYWGMTAVSLSMLVFGYRFLKKESVYEGKEIIHLRSRSGYSLSLTRPELRSRIGSFSALILVFLFITTTFPYVNQSKQFVSSVFGGNVFPSNKINKDFFVQRFASDDKKFYSTSLDTNPYINSGFTPSADGFPALPWVTHLYEKEIIAKLTAENTPLIFYSPDSYYRQNTLHKFAPNLAKFIETNYTKIDGNFTFYWQDWISGAPINQPQDGVWVLSKRFPNAMEMLKKEYPEVFNYKIGLTLPSSDQNIRTGEILADTKIVQSVLVKENEFSGIQLLISKYGLGRSSYIIRVLNEKNEVIRQGNFSLRNVVDNSYFIFNFPTIQNSKGKKFNIEIAANPTFAKGDFNVTSGNSLILWLTEPNFYKEGELKIDGIRQDNSVALNLIFRND